MARPLLLSCASMGLRREPCQTPRPRARALACCSASITRLQSVADCLSSVGAAPSRLYSGHGGGSCRRSAGCFGGSAPLYRRSHPILDCSAAAQNQLVAHRTPTARSPPPAPDHGMEAQQQSPGSEGAAPSTSGRSPTALVSATAAAAAAAAAVRLGLYVSKAPLPAGVNT